MGEAERHDKLLALLGGAVADAVDLQLLLEAFGDTDHHIVEQGPGQAMQAAVELFIVGPGHMDHAVRNGDVHVGMQGLGQLPSWGL